MNFENFVPKVFRGEEKLRQKASPKEKYQSSPQEVVLELRDCEGKGKFLGGNVGGARFVKIKDDGGAFSSPTLIMRTSRIEKLVI